MLSASDLISIASIIPAFIISIFLFGRNKVFKPFILLILIAGIVELSSMVLRYNNLNNLWLLNTLIIVVFFLMIWQFVRWGFLSFQSALVKLSFILVSALWIIESIIHSGVKLNDYTSVLSGFILIILCTIYINRLIFEKVRYLLLDSRFLIAIGTLIYFTTNMVIFIFHGSTIKIFAEISSSLWAIHNWINTFTNIIYTIALLCIPKK